MSCMHSLNAHPLPHARRRMVAYLLSTMHPLSQEASNLKAMGEWLTTLHSCKLGVTMTQAQKNMLTSNKLLSEATMMSIVDKHMDDALAIVGDHPYVEAQDPHFGNHATHEQCKAVQVACLLGMTFGYLPSPRPGMLRHLVHPSSPKASLARCTCCCSQGCMAHTNVRSNGCHPRPTCV